jgi:hypothetical protein
MDQFPSYLNPGQLDHSFSKERFEIQLKRLREHIHDVIISKSFKIPDSCGIDLNGFSPDQITSITNTANVKYKIDKKMIDIIIKELNALGWTTTLGYGDTVLFVHTADKLPPMAVKCSTIFSDL